MKAMAAKVKKNSKSRINLSVGRDTREILELLAKRDEKPVARKVMDLVDFALEFEEDAALYQLAMERKAIETKYIPHDKFWKKVLSRYK